MDSLVEIDENGFEEHLRNKMKEELAQLGDSHPLSVLYKQHLGEFTGPFVDEKETA